MQRRFTALMRWHTVFQHWSFDVQIVLSNYLHVFFGRTHSTLEQTDPINGHSGASSTLMINYESYLYTTMTESCLLTVSVGSQNHGKRFPGLYIESPQEEIWG